MLQKKDWQHSENVAGFAVDKLDALIFNTYNEMYMYLKRGAFGLKRAERLFLQICNSILSGELGKNGDRFMTVRDFAKQNACSLHCALDVFQWLLDCRILRKAGKNCYITIGRCSPKSAYGKILSNSGRNLFGVLLNENSNPFFGSLIDQLQAALRKNGMDMITATSGGDVDRERHVLDLFVELKCRGVFNCVAIRKEQQDFFSYYPLPVVTLAENGNLLCGDSIVVDNFASGKQVAQHLLATGCSSFAYLTLDNYIETDMRLQGYCQHLASRQVTLDGHHIGVVSSTSDDLRMREINQFVHYLLDEINTSDSSLPLGIFCVHDLLAVEVMRIIKHVTLNKQRKLQIPEDVRIVGFDDLPIASLVSTPITSVSYPYAAMAAKACDVMMDYLNNPEHSPKCYEIQSSLIIRKSSCIPGY